MKAYYDIQQGTEAWHELRYGKISGTLASGLFVKSDNLLDEILSAKSEDFEPDFDSYTSSDMQRGNELESIAREQLEQYTGIKFNQCGWLQCEENELLGISADGINEDETITCEIKCPGAKKHLQTIKSGEIPLDNIDQCVHYFTINPKLEKHFFVSFRPENKFKALFVKELTRDSIVNIGTNAKPVTVTVSDAVLIAKGSAASLLVKVDEKLKELSF